MKEVHSVSLVLGSGGARGHAHIGVVRAVLDRGYAIRNIAGTSMGALIGGVYAAGALDTYSDWAFHLERRDVVRLLDVSFTRHSLFKGERVFDVLRELLGERQIEDLDRGFVAVATDINAQREVWLNRGELFRAIRASSAVPGVFTPVMQEGRVLVDGGLVNPIPIAPTLTDTTDATIAVNLNALGSRRGATARQQHRAEKAEKVEKSADADAESYRERIAQFFRDQLGDSEPTEPQPSAMELLSKSFDTMQGQIARMKLATYAPTVTVDIPRSACGFFEFDRGEELAEIGYEAATRALAGLGPPATPSPVA
ncbi:patatin-like phospholipase family protein [Pseudohaliea rubra]|uniref:Protein YchK n=1 Tax=Pseudohaliea rubra DSM 19751 TaxID=1265313 RepID=A0A095X1V5_9GAMM|nr:patatin-like phospholipase family protein [Pseudohaliea rubra]KGE04864.1 protein YchK [Pseudohaliea rubra DSM 19751]